MKYRHINDQINKTDSVPFYQNNMKYLVFETVVMFEWLRFLCFCYDSWIVVCRSQKKNANLTFTLHAQKCIAQMMITHSFWIEPRFFFSPYPATACDHQINGQLKHSCSKIKQIPFERNNKKTPKCSMLM